MKVEGFIGGQDVQKSLNLSDNQCINLYPTTNNDGSIQAFYKVDGLKEEAILSGVPAGAYKTSTGRQFYVSGTTLYELSNSLVSTARGTLTAGTYSFSDNGIELICVNGIDGWLFVLATNTLTKIKVLTGDVTITVASPAVLTKTNHGLIAGDRVILSTTGVLPDGFTTNTPYYVIAGGLTANNFELSETSGGTAISTINDYFDTIQSEWGAIATDGTNSVVVARTGAAKAAISSSGRTWTASDIPTNLLIGGIAWNGSIFCAVGYSLTVTQQIFTSPDGITWTARSTPAARGYVAICWNGSIFCAVSAEGVVAGQVITSPDGITWTSRSSSFATNWGAIAWNGTIFVSVAGGGATQVMTSPDGITWTNRVAAAANQWSDVIWNGAQFVAVSTDGASQVMVSTDGITWTSKSATSSQTWSALAKNTTTTVAVCSGSKVMYSSDYGNTWTETNAAESLTWNGVVWDGSKFIAIAGNGTYSRAMISTDGITWTNYNHTGTHTFTTLGYGFPEGCSTVSYMNGRFIAIEKNTQNFFVSEVYDGWWWDALNVQTVDSNPDFCIGQAVSHNELIVFCENSGEVFFDSGTTPTPFIRNRSGIFEVGCLAEKSIAKLDNTIFWLGRTAEGKGIVYRLDGYTPSRISTYAVEHSINSMTDASDAKAFSYQKDGHHFYVLKFPTGNKTWVFDANTNLWHERASFISSTFAEWEPEDHLFFNNKHYVTSSDNKLYSIDGDTYQNGGNPIKVVRSFRAPSSDMKRVVHGRLQLEAEFGVTPIDQEEAMMMLRWSNDGGHTWSNILEKGIGKVGEYFRRVIWNRLGMTKGIPRVYEISNTDNVKIVLLSVYLE